MPTWSPAPAMISEADSCTIAALVLLTGFGSGLAYVGSRRKWTADTGDVGRKSGQHPLELIEAEDFRELRRSGSLFWILT